MSVAKVVADRFVSGSQRGIHRSGISFDAWFFMINTQTVGGRYEEVDS